jgi:hypothetical protein
MALRGDLNGLEEKNISFAANRKITQYNYRTKFPAAKWQQDR